jgi:hypothetical protein
VIANAVFGGLINDVVPPALIGRFFGLFRAVSLLAGIIFNFWQVVCLCVAMELPNVNTIFVSRTNNSVVITWIEHNI